MGKNAGISLSDLSRQHMTPSLTGSTETSWAVPKALVLLSGSDANLDFEDVPRKLLLHSC